METGETPPAREKRLDLPTCFVRTRAEMCSPRSVILMTFVGGLRVRPPTPSKRG